MNTWQPFADAPECKPPDAGHMVEAIGELQTMSWMQRPVGIRGRSGESTSELKSRPYLVRSRKLAPT